MMRWAAVVIASVIALALAAWWVLLTQIVPKIDQWREPLAQQASSTLGLPVQIGRVTGRADGWWPEVTLEEVRFLDPAGRTALRLPRITTRLSPSSLWPTSLWRRELHVDRLVLLEPQLDVRRDAQGRLHVAGLTLDPGKTGSQDSPATDWLLDQRLIRIERGAITWTDEMRQAGPLRLTHVDLSLTNQPGLARRVHDWKLAATPPAGFGRRFQAHVRVSQPLWARSRATPDDETTLPGLWQRWLGQPTRPSDWRNWSGQATVEMPQVDVQRLQQHATLPVEVQGGRGRVSLKLAVAKGQPRELAAEVDVQDVAVRLGPTLKPLAFRQVAGTITAHHQSRETVVGWKDLRFTTDDGLVWPSSQARLQWQHAPAPASNSGALLPELRGNVWHRTLQGRLSTDRLDLALLARLADRLPLASSWRQQLAQLAPVGVAESLKLSWEGPIDTPRRYDVQGSVTGVGWQAGRHPGLAGGDLRFNANEKGGEAEVSITKGWMEFPGAFEEPRIPLERMSAVVAWRITPPGKGQPAPQVVVEVGKATFANSDAQGVLRARWQTGEGSGVGAQGRYPGRLELSGKLSRAQGARVWRYLPASILPEARYYVRDAVRDGMGENVNFEVKGDLWRFPFPDDEGGKFRISVPVRNATLDYVPGDKPPPGSVAAAPYWPVFTRLNGMLLFEGHRMRIEGATAMLGNLGTGGFALEKVSGEVPDLAADEPRLRIQGEGRGPLDDLLRYATVSPVGGWTGHMLSEARGGGQAALKLELDIPLNHVEDTRLKGQVSMLQADQAALRLGPQVPPMQNVRGQVQFTESTLKVAGVARVWGQDIQINGSRDTNGTPRFVANGLVSAEGLRSADSPMLARLARRLSGQTPVTVTVALNRTKSNVGLFTARPELQVSSTLQGLGMDLPAPLQKDATASWPLKIVHRSDDAEGHTDTLLVDLQGPVMARAEYRRNLQGPQPVVSRGALSLTAAGSPVATPIPPEGVAAQVVLPVLDVDAWQLLASQIKAPGPSTASATATTTATAATPPTEQYMPDSLTLKVGSLTWQQRTLKDVAVTLAHPAPGVWRAQIDAKQLAGQIEVHPDANAPAEGLGGSRVTARLSRLQVPEAEADALQSQAARQLLTNEPVSVPALDIVIDKFEWRGLPLGKLEVEAINRGSAGPQATALPEWRLTKFRLGNADAQLSAVGNWAAMGSAAASKRKSTGPLHRAAFSFTLDLANSGNLLTRLGFRQTLRGGKGKMVGQVSWLGSPLDPDVASMSGDINVSIDQGQFLKVEPGAAKLLGVLSLQSLPRRLALDFRDVFQSGFAFDRIEGDVSIKQGVASTRNLRMRGVQALVLMEGQADLAQETQNLRVFVLPELNAGTASLAYAAINPAIGLGTFIAQVLLRKAVVDATTREFLITGSWADPQVERIKRSAAAQRTGEAASAALPDTPASSP